MKELIGLLILLCKGSQAARDLADQFISAYSTWKVEQNFKAQNEKDVRNNAAVDTAVDRMPNSVSEAPSVGNR